MVLDFRFSQKLASSYAILIEFGLSRITFGRWSECSLDEEGIAEVKIAAAKLQVCEPAESLS